MTDDVGFEALRLLTIKDVAGLLHVDPRTVWRLVDAERRHPGTGLESVKIGHAVRIPPDVVAAYIKRLRAQAGAA